MQHLSPLLPTATTRVALASRHLATQKPAIVFPQGQLLDTERRLHLVMKSAKSPTSLQCARSRSA